MTALRKWLTLDDIREMELRDGIRYELVDGQAVAMVGGTQAHDIINLSLASAIRFQLKGSKCRPFTGNMRVKIPNGNYRYPDISIDCNPVDLSSIYTGDPSMVIEILSESTEFFDENDKLEEYKSIPSLIYIMLISQDRPYIQFYRRDDNQQWQGLKKFTEANNTIRLPLIGIELTLAQIYEDLPHLFKQ